MRRISSLTIFTAIIICMSNAAFGQTHAGNKAAATELCIEDCYSAVERNYPAVKQYDLIEKSKEYTIANAARAYIPQVSFSARAGWQSDVTRFSIDKDKLAESQFGSMLDADEIESLLPQISKDQYAANIEINQTLWDGGSVKAQKDAAKADAEAQKRALDASIYTLRAKVNDLYFGILLLQENDSKYMILSDTAEENLSKANSFMNQGLIGQDDVDAIRIQVLSFKQQRAKLAATKSAYITMLAILTGLEIDETTALCKPEETFTGSGNIHRPELASFEAELKQVDAGLTGLNTAVTPKFGLYVTGGYGRPGLNMLDNSFRPYMTAGIRMQWNIAGFYNLKTNRKTLENRRRQIEIRRDTFLIGVEMDAARESKEIENLIEQIRYDGEIERLRRSVRIAGERKLEEGTISGKELTSLINDELAAGVDKSAHEIQMLHSMYNLKYARGE